MSYGHYNPVELTRKTFGYFDKARELWMCPDFGLSSPSFNTLVSMVKAKEKELRALNVVAVFIGDYMGQRAHQVSIVSTHGMPTCVYAREAGEGKQKVYSLRTLMEETPENVAALRASKIKLEEAEILRREAHEMYNAIPRLTIQEVRRLSILNCPPSSVERESFSLEEETT